MATDLSQFIPNLQREVNAPGAVNFPNGTDEDWVGNLVDGFWEVRLDGMLKTYSCTEDGMVFSNSQTIPISSTAVNNTDPTAAGTDPSVSADGIDREMVQLVIFYAGARILRNQLRMMRTAFSATAGPTKFEYQQSANMLTAILKDLTERRNLLLLRLSDVGTVPAYITDAVVARDQSMRLSDTWWVSAGGDFSGSGTWPG